MPANAAIFSPGGLERSNGAFGGGLGRGRRFGEGLGLGMVDTTAHSAKDVGYAVPTSELRAGLKLSIPADEDLTALSKLLNEALEAARAKDGEARSTGWNDLFNDLVSSSVFEPAPCLASRTRESVRNC